MASNNIFQKAEDWLDDLETVGNYAAEKIGDVTKDMPIVKALGNIAANPTKQEIGSQVAYLASATNKGLQESFGGDPVDMALNYGPNAMGTIVGKSAAGWAKLPNKFSNMLDKMERAEISDVGAKVNYGGVKAELESAQKYGEKSANVSLGFLLNHPELYKQYPELRGMRVYIGKTPAGTNALITNGADGKAYILINKDLATMPEAKQTLLHEIQHAIQEQEGFTRGGSPSMFPQKYSDAYPVYKRYIDEATDAYVLRGNMEKNNISVGEAKEIFRKEFGRDPLANSGYMAKTMGKNEISSEIDRLAENLKKSKNAKDPMEQYMLLAGEIEARSVASRSNIPQEQLKYSQPYAGEGIPLKEWIKAEDFLGATQKADEFLDFK